MPEHELDGNHVIRAEKRNKFLRFNAYAAAGLAAIQLAVNILGRIFVWLVHVRHAMKGTEQTITLPDPPWGLFTAIGSFVVLSLVGYAFWSNQVGEPGRAIDMVLDMIPSFLKKKKDDK